MFKGRQPARSAGPAADGEATGERPGRRPRPRSATWSPRSASSSRSRACRRRRPPRRGNLIGALGARVALADGVPLAGPRQPAADPRSRSWSARRSPSRPRATCKMTQMPQLVALFNGVGGGAAALVALLELDELGITAGVVVRLHRRRADGRDAVRRPARDGVHRARRVGVVRRLGGHVRQAAGADDHPPGDPAGRAGPDGRGLLALARARRRARRPARRCRWPCVLGAVGLLAGVLLVLPVGGADVPIVISLLNAFTGLTVAAGGFVLGNTLLLVAGTLVGASGTILTRAMASAMGRSVGGIMFGALKGGSTAGSTAVSDRPVQVGAAGRRRDPARLRPQGRRRARATGSRSRRRSTRSASWPRCWRPAASTWCTASTRSPAACPGT